MQTIQNTETNLTLPHWGGAAPNPPSTIRIMNCPQKFPLSAITSKQKNVRK